jgi:hypothetical protein
MQRKNARAGPGILPVLSARIIRPGPFCPDS